jgi:hypothetical protein
MKNKIINNPALLDFRLVSGCETTYHAHAEVARVTVLIAGLVERERAVVPGQMTGRSYEHLRR